VPAFNVGGWYDIFLSGTLENFTRLRSEGATDAARAGTRLLVGPWGHGSAFGAYPDHKLPGLEARIDLAGLQLEYFERHLRGGDADDGLAPVRIFVMGENQWRDEADWPPPKASAERWFLREHSLSPEPPADEPHDEYIYDPRDPAPTIGGPTSLPGRMMRPSAGPHDQRPLERRDDVLVYTSDPLEQPLEVTGPIELVLFAATSAPDTDFVAKLCDVDPEGRSRILAEGVLRARFRDGFEAPKPVEPDRVYELRLDLIATSNVFLGGHSIRLDVTSSSHPRFDRNANTGRAPGEDTEETLTPATQRVFHDSDRASHLLLSVVRR
jgi:putative CocE/NonD family hydrolase